MNNLNKLSYNPQGVCSRQIDIETSGNIITKVNFTGGCHGNTQAVAALVEGMEINHAISKLQGIDCKGRGTSCPDQLARALESMK